MRLARRAFAFNLTRFLAVGTAGLVTDTLLFSILSNEGLSDAVARALSLTVATGVTWRLNRRFTFGQSERRQRFEGGLYAVVAFCAQGLNYAVFLTLRDMVPMLPAIGAILVSAAFAAAFSYSGQRFITFRGQIRA
jgi:putative flippase GtrA